MLEFDVETNNKINSICQQIANLYKKQLQDDDAVATGNLLRSVDNWNTVINGDVFELWFNLEHYWQYSPENKRKGHNMPPVKAIKDWIEAKHLDLNEWAVAKNIAKFGWRNQPRQNYLQFMQSFDMHLLEDELQTVIFHAIEKKTMREITDEILGNL